MFWWAGADFLLEMETTQDVPPLQVGCVGQLTKGQLPTHNRSRINSSLPLSGECPFAAVCPGRAWQNEHLPQQCRRPTAFQQNSPILALGSVTWALASLGLCSFLDAPAPPVPRLSLAMVKSCPSSRPACHAQTRLVWLAVQGSSGHMPRGQTSFPKAPCVSGFVLAPLPMSCGRGVVGSKEKKNETRLSFLFWLYFVGQGMR